MTRAHDWMSPHCTLYSCITNLWRYVTNFFHWIWNNQIKTARSFAVTLMTIFPLQGNIHQMKDLREWSGNRSLDCWCDTVTVLWQWSSMNHPVQRFQRVDTWCKAIAKYLNWFSRFVVDDIRPTSGSQKSENQRKFCKALTVAVTCANVFFFLNFRIAITRLGINDMAPVRLFNSHVLYIDTFYLSQLQSFQVIWWRNLEDWEEKF